MSRSTNKQRTPDIPTSSGILPSSVNTNEIANDAVTFDKVQNIETARLLGRSTAGSGNVEELTGGQASAILNITPSPFQKVKPITQAVASSTTLTNDTVFNIAIEANSTYYVYMDVYVEKGGSNYIYQINLPSGSSNFLYINDATPNSGNTSSGFIESIQYVSSINQTITKTTNGFIKIRGIIKTVSAGNFIYKFAQSSSDINAALTLRGSTLELVKTNDVFPTITAENFTVDHLVIAGGGAGGGLQYSPGYGGAGGGGAGGYRETTGATLQTLSTYTVTVGAGGAVNNWGNGNNGSNSVFSGTTSNGGGGGGSYSSATSGGSGGGNSGTFNYSAAAGTSGQGNAGGVGAGSSTSGGGGGGGKSAVGSNGTTSVGGAGGDGASSSITGTAVTRAGGGGGGGASGIPGGAGGSGGGGAGSGTQGGGVTGSANTGGGGGGSQANTSYVGAGGSGVVIVSYPQTYFCMQSLGLTSSESIVSTKRVRIFTAGTGTIEFIKL